MQGRSQDLSQDLTVDGAADDDRKLVEAEWASQCLADLLDKANAPIFAIDGSGLITEWNIQIGELTGFTKDSIMGKHLMDYVSEASRKTLTDGLAVSAKGEMGPPFELQLKKSGGGKDVKINVGLSPQFGSKDQVIGSLGVGQVALESEQSAPPAAPAAPAGPTGEGSSRKTKGMVVHELRSPLHGIIGLANTLSQDESPLQKPLKMIGSSAERVLELITNFMDYNDLSEVPSMDVNRDTVDTVDISALVNESLARTKQAKDKRGKPMLKDKVTVTKEMGKGIPTFMGDQQALSQMLYHLFLNAVKFTHQGSVKINVTHNKAQNAIEISVEDTGIGIEEANMKRIFEPFQQEDTSESRRYEGIGLGLAIVREVLRIHNGTVDLKSTPGKGSRFQVSLPTTIGGSARERGSAPAAGETAAARAPPRAVRPRSGPRVRPASWLGPRGLLVPPEPPAKSKAAAKAAGALPPPAEAHSRQVSQPAAVLPPPPPRSTGGPRVIMSVDDDHVNQEVMRSVLEPCGFSMVICMSGNECLEYMAKDKTLMPDLILLDLMMPGINGFDVLQEQRKTYAPEQLPIIMVSAKNQASSVVKGLELGCNDWIHKPFDRQELMARVQAHLKWKDNMLAMQHLLAAQGTANAEAVTHRPAPTPKPVASFIPITSPIDTSVMFVTIQQQSQGETEHILTRLFELFEVLSEKYDAVRTEIIGSSYIAVARSTDDGTRHADKMLQLALSIEEAIDQMNRESNRLPSLQFKAGIHTDTGVPPIIDGRKGHSPRQYPTSSFFCSTVCGAKHLVEGSTVGGGIFLSRSARCRLSADIENEMSDRGLQMVGRPDGSAPGERLGEHFWLVKAGMQLAGVQAAGVQAAGMSPTGNGAVAQTAVAMNAAADGRLVSEGEVRKLHVELQSSKGLLDSAHSKLNASEQQLAGSRAEVRALRMQVDELTTRLTADRAQQQRAPAVSNIPQAPPALHMTNGEAGTVASAPTLFLQWQNAHLQAELRYYQEALARAKGQLQVQTVRSQSMEKLQGALQERIEHLELDLGLQAVRSGSWSPALSGLGFTASGAYSAGTGLPAGLGFAGGGALSAGLPAGIGCGSGALSAAGLGTVVSDGLGADFSAAYGGAGYVDIFGGMHAAPGLAGMPGTGPAAHHGTGPSVADQHLMANASLG